MRHGVYPFRPSAEVPELPEKTADEAGQEQKIKHSKGPLFPLPQKRGATRLVIERFQEEYESAPDKGEKVLRPDERQSEKECSRDREGLVEPLRGEKRGGFRIFQHSEKFQQRRCRKNSRQNRRIGNGVSDPPDRRLVRNVYVAPVGEAKIQGFEDEPHGCGQGKKEEEFPGILEKERFGSPAIEERLDKDNVAPPGKRIIAGIKGFEFEQHGEGGNAKDQAAGGSEDAG